jgi:hypothetical protein
VCIFHEDDQDALSEVMDAEEVHLFEIAQGPRTLESFATAVKHCALLAQGPWCIFIKLQAAQLAYGVMRRRYGTTEPYISPVKEGRRRLIWLQPVEKHLLRLSNGGTEFTDVDFRVLPGGTGRSSHDERRKLVSCLTEDCWKTHEDALKAVCEDVIDRALIHGHGFLVAITKRKSDESKSAETRVPDPPDEFRDRGLLFTKWLIPTQLKVATLYSYQLYRATRSQRAHEDQAAKQQLAVEDPARFARQMTRRQAEVEAWSSLIATMLMSDGITWFDTSGRVLGFRIFVRSSTNTNEGGSRTRAFRVLADMVDKGRLHAAFMQSQDGAALFKTR